MNRQRNWVTVDNLTLDLDEVYVLIVLPGMQYAIGAGAQMIGCTAAQFREIERLLGVGKSAVVS